MLLHSAPDPTLHVENLGTVDGPHRHSSRCSCSSLQGSRRSAPVRIFRNHPPSRDCSAEYTTPPVLRRTHLLECANGSAPHSQVLRAHAGMRKDYGECGHETRLLGPRLRPHFEEKQNTRLRNCKSLYPPATIAFRSAAKATLHEQRGGHSPGNQRRPASLAH